MITEPEFVAPIVAELRRLADLVESGEIAPPDSTSLTWHLDERETGVAVARTLAREWTASSDSPSGGVVAKTTLLPGRWPFSPLVDATLFVAGDEPERPRRTASERFVRELSGVAEVEQ